MTHWVLEQLQEKTKTDLTYITLEFYDLELPTSQHGVRAMDFSVVAPNKHSKQGLFKKE